MGNWKFLSGAGSTIKRAECGEEAEPTIGFGGMI
jgi:hypothetical protein